MTDPKALAEANIAYRRPDLYDQLTRGDDQAHLVAVAVATLGVTVRTVLDLGSGTGRDLAAFQERYGWSGVGIDIQPDLIGYARSTRPGLDLRVDDLRTVRLGRTFDLITCLGNSLAYLHTDPELAAAAAAMAAHSHPGTVLVVNTLTGPPLSTSVQRVVRVKTDELSALVTLDTEWNPETRLYSTRRQWSFDDETTATDRFSRRVTTRAELDRLLRSVGFHLVDSDGPVAAVYRPTG